MTALRFEHRIDNRKQDRYVTQNGDCRSLQVCERGTFKPIWEMQVPEEWKGLWAFQVHTTFPYIQIIIDVKIPTKMRMGDTGSDEVQCHWCEMVHDRDETIPTFWIVGCGEYECPTCQVCAQQNLEYNDERGDFQMKKGKQCPSSALLKRVRPSRILHEGFSDANFRQ